MLALSTSIIQRGGLLELDDEVIGCELQIDLVGTLQDLAAEVRQYQARCAEALMVFPDSGIVQVHG